MVLDEFSLEGKIAIVTGASRGLGKAISLCLAEADCNVVVTSRSLRDLEQTALEINQKGRIGVPLETDIRNWKQVERMVEATIERFGKVDILVNNAGMVIEKPLLETTEEEWRNVVDTDLTGTFFCSKAVGKYMIKQGGGKIINISSAFGIKVPENVVSYSAAKGAVFLFTRALAVEWGKYKINVNCIAPGHFYTAFTDKVLDNPKLLNIILRKIPLGRYAQPHELGGLVVFLASKASDFMTGEAIVIDGGLTIKV
jgi:NAD(P)-dependent dehydrogenase (short-subunit alcohol dehydrogenase family)